MPHIHFIAIGGSIMHQLAIALHQKGYQITGSDDEIFDPAKSNLFKHGLLPETIGWFPNKLTSETEGVILGMHARKDNPELLAAQSMNIPIYSFPEYIYEQSKNKKRVVVSGSHGKTTITSMLMHVLKYWQYDFDYLVGAALEGFPYSVRITENAPLIIIEGDEYLSSPLHRIPKIHFYQPHIALMSGIAWDHMNVFPTFDNYLSQFQKFVDGIENGNTFIYNQEDKYVNELGKNAEHLTTKAYQTPDFGIIEQQYFVKSPTAKQMIPLQIFGNHNLQNMEGARLVCNELGISNEQFYEAIQQFKGAARRLELVAEGKETIIYKDFAHAPSKVQATTQAMKDRQPDRKLVACLELHTYSSLNKDFLPNYRHTLQAADHAIVFFKEHTLAIKKLPPLSIEEVHQTFDHPNLQVFTQSDALIAELNNINWSQTNLLFMSSGNFGGINMKDIAKFALPKSPFPSNQPDMLQLKRPLAIFDLEATGINIAKDRIVEISILKVLPDGSEVSKTLRINPSIPIPPHVSEIHGIYDEDIKDAPTFAEVAKELDHFLKDCDFAGYNSNRYDIPLLNEEFLRVDMDLQIEQRKSIDVFRIFQKKESRDLKAAYKFYCDKQLENAHSAEADVKATYEVLMAQLGRYEDLQNDVKFLDEYTTDTSFVDFGRRLIRDEKGVIKINFGKHKGRPVEEVLTKHPQYYDWIMRNDFLLDTKKKLTAIRLQMKFKK